MAPTASNPFAGNWTYRSFHNNSTFRLEDCKACADLRALIFAEARLVIDAVAWGEFGGRLVLGPGAEMALTGASSYGNPFAVHFQGRGVSEGIEDFVYDYVGYLVPTWPNGVDQTSAIVGSVVRTEPHSGGAQPGYVASWVAVRRD